MQLQITSGKIPCAQKVVIYGPEGIGKSTFAAKFPDPVFIDTEGSTKHMDVARFPKPASWPVLVEEVKQVRDAPDTCKTLIVDTADWAEQLCIQQICSKSNKNGIEDFGYGKGYVYVAEAFNKMLNLLDEVIDRGIHVVLTAHAKMRKFEQPDEMGAYDRWEMKLSKNVAPMVKEWADMVLFANYKTFTVRTEDNKIKAQGGDRVMYTTHHSCWDAKNRQGLKPELPFQYSEIAGCIQEQPAGVPSQKTEMELACALEEPPADFEVLEDEKPGSGDVGTSSELEELMSKHGVTERKLQQVIAEKGFYPEGTPIKNYDTDFVDYLISVWDQILAKIQENSQLPF